MKLQQISRLKYIATYSELRDKELDNGNTIEELVPILKNVHFTPYKLTLKEANELRSNESWTDTVSIIIRHRDSLKVDANHSFKIGKPFNDRDVDYSLVNIQRDYDVNGYDVVTLRKQV